MRYLLLSLAVLAAMGPLCSQNQKLEFADPVKLPATVNSDAEEGLPVITNDGKTLYFVRTFHEQNMGGPRGGQDIWYSEKGNSGWEEAKNDLLELNNAENNAVTGLNNTGDVLYLHGTYIHKEELRTGLSFSKKAESGWSDPKYVHVPHLAILSDHYSFSLDPVGRFMAISSKGKKSKGEEDLYICLRNKQGRWGKPIHMGSVINTKGYEIGPFLTDNGRTLYFASNGREDSHGDADIYVTYRLDESWTNWSEPKNLGPQINSKAFDAYFTVNENGQVFFASNRDGELSDLYSTQFLNYEKPEIPIAGGAGLNIADESTADEAGTMQPEEEMVTGIFEYNSLPAANTDLELVDENGNVLQVIKTDENGMFEYQKLALEQGYVLRLAEADADAIADSKVFLVDQEGDKMVEATPDERGVFQFTKLSKDQLDGLAISKAEDATSLVITSVTDDRVVVNGQFEYENLPAEGVRMNLLDEEEVVIKFTTTDEDGKFSFDNLEPNSDYVVSIADNQDIPKDAKLYLLDDDGNKLLLMDQGQEPGKYVMRAYSKDDLDKLPKMEEEDGTLIAAGTPEPKPAPTPTPAPNPTPDPTPNPTPDPEPTPTPKPTPKPTPAPKPAPKPAAKPTPVPKPAPETPKPANLPFMEGVKYFNYGFNEWTMSDADRDYLTKEVVPRLTADPNMKVVVHGHADSEGSAKNNMVVSKNRAMDVRQFLMTRLIEGERIETKHFGEDRPIMSNDTIGGRAQNRRVEIQLIKN